MKKKIVLLYCCFFLVGCPPISQDPYHYVGADCIRSTSWNRATIQLIDKRIIDVTCTYFKDYTPNRGQGLFAKLEFPENLFSEEELDDIKIVSSTLGKFSRVSGQPDVYEGKASYNWYKEITDTVPELKYKRRDLKSDTITIIISNTTLSFTRKKPSR
ncbi:hypothetical protein [Dokdonia sp.]|uniref:hypothetical protein n=1 Tax=Dokdonia sp. TaxID=2024995 RepID=UPI003264664C